ncbi:cytochrome c oxidase, subunit II [Deinococcus peraridilitoris DSM 19664]|uniref:Cytochrome c oxidase subunit 2 n=1 Tax=Deinococcus peraridilitoris (strain DSM 19664 / LMG 22246 / CIP 109416 / KR-200) TaxID=937777 RepID=K9ZX58_DEIPD|nr:cytochrome c oxidase, subunit II [Deinococcus peraridilitoris DSM 19664]
MNTFSHLPAHLWRQGNLHAMRAAALFACGAGVAFAQDKETRNFLFLGDLASRYNREVWEMSIPAIIMSILIAVATSWALFYSVIKFRERKGEVREPAQFHGNNVLEIALIAVPFLIVTVLAILTVRTMVRINNPDIYAKSLRGEPVQVDVLAAQFWWNFTYPQLGNIANGNEMVMPQGRAIRTNITSRDVMHQFWAPNIGGQRAAIPGVQKEYTLDIERPGIYQGNCTQLCGPSHANMRYKVVVLAENDWNAFVTAARAYRAPVPAPGSSEARGQQIFLQGKNGSPSCAGCHRVQGLQGAAGLAGPDLSYFASRNTLGAGMWEGEAARERLKEWILNSPGLKPGSLMPAYRNVQTGKSLLSEQDLDDLEAYLLTLKLPPAAEYWNKVPSR